MDIPIRNIIFLLVFVGGGVLLQIFLSKRERKWPGLVLPGISFAYSLLAVFSVAVYEGMSGWDVFGLSAVAFISFNIPTLVLLAIYAACRPETKRKKELDKMNIHDL